MKMYSILGAAVLGCAVLPVTDASAAFIATGTYRLHNHTDGNARPPAYGAKLTEMYNATSGTDIFTFNFDAPGSAMYLDYNGSSIHIYGTSFGGRDVGTDYANDIYRGFYQFDFTYNLGVIQAPGDDDIMVAGAQYQYNYGTLLTPLGDIVSLRDGHYGNGQPDFRFGDEDNDQGHRGFPGLSGWGWLYKHLPGQPYTYVADSDWLFTGELVPTPGALSLLAGAGLLAGRRRRN